jgi:hypothetical protein
LNDIFEEIKEMYNINELKFQKNFYLKEKYKAQKYFFFKTYKKISFLFKLRINLLEKVK